MSNGYWIPAICPNCGANMSVAKDDVHANCPYCGSSFVANRATAKFNATYMTNHINANVAYFGDNSKDFEIVAGELKRYTGSGVDVVVPDGVETIGSGVFKCQGIHSIRLPSSTTAISSEAFYGCRKLTQVDIPNVKRIGAEAFCNCSVLTRIDMPNVEEIYNEAFRHCSALTRVNLPQTLKTIGGDVFLDTGLTDINFPTSLECIGRRAFHGMKLKSVTIKHRSALLGGYAFEDSSIIEVKISGSMRSFFNRKSWSKVVPLFINAPLKVIIFDDYSLTPDRLEKDIDFNSKDEYDLYRTIFSGNRSFGEAMNKRLKTCIENRVCPICNNYLKPDFTAFIRGVPPSTHCNHCNLVASFLKVDLRDPNEPDYSDD